MYPGRMDAGAVRGWLRAVALVLALGAMDARGAHAQRVEGQIMDAESSAPIAGATLLLVNVQGQTVHRTTSNGRGYFTLQAREPGVYRIHASRLGYRDATSGAVDLVSTRELDVTLHLSSDAVRLEPLTVTGIPQSERLLPNGFYARRAQFGPDGANEAHFLEPHDIERRNAFSPADLFTNLPGVRTNGTRISMRRGCQPAIVIDGVVARPGRSSLSRVSIMPPTLDLRELASVQGLAGVEVYYGDAMPARYMIDAGGCGVILYWTK